VIPKRMSLWAAMAVANVKKDSLNSELSMNKKSS
jgi:hypothetical protein